MEHDRCIRTGDPAYGLGRMEIVGPATPRVRAGFHLLESSILTPCLDLAVPRRTALYHNDADLRKLPMTRQ